MRNVVVGAGGGAALMALVMSLITPPVEDLEGTKYKAYIDLGGVPTVCSGTTGPDVVLNKIYKPEECTALTKRDLEKAANGVLKYSPQLLYHPVQLAAVTSYTYNAGIRRYKENLAPIFNTGDLKAGCTRLKTATITVNGKVTQGLINRRLVEYNICMSTLTPEGLKNVTTP